MSTGSARATVRSRSWERAGSESGFGGPLPKREEEKADGRTLGGKHPEATPVDPRRPRPDEFSVGTPRPDEFWSERPVAFSSSSCLPLLPGIFPQSFPVALELRRVGVDPRPRIVVGADATVLQALVSSRAEAEAFSRLPSPVFLLPSRRRCSSSRRGVGAKRAQRPARTLTRTGRLRPGVRACRA